jgi:hypothetical protein
MARMRYFLLGLASLSSAVVASMSSWSPAMTAPSRAPAAIVVVILLAVSFIGAVHLYRSLFSPASTVQLLRRSPKAAAAYGVVVGRAVVVPAPGADPLCVVSYRSGRNRRFEVLHEGVEIRFEDGRSFTVPPKREVEITERARPTGQSLPDDLQRRLRRRADLDPSKSADLGCVDETRRVFAFGCVDADDPEVLVPCAGERAVEIELDRAPRAMVQGRAATATLGGGLGLLALLVAAFVTWRNFGFFPDIIEDLIQRGRLARLGPDAAPKPGLALYLVMFVVTMCVGVGAAMLGFSGWYLASFAVVSLALILGWSLLVRRGPALRAVLVFLRRAEVPNKQEIELGVRRESRLDTVLGGALIVAASALAAACIYAATLG